MSSPHQTPGLRSPPSGAPRGKYHIVKPLKIGGTAAIYLAVMRGENNFSREVVIKRPLPHLVAEPRSRNMFTDEAHIASRLSHPNICQVLDLVARDDELYIVLEYLRGVDLREILKRCIQLGRLPPLEVAVWVAIEVAAGLGYAHDAIGLDGRPLNLVHRDVSPKNIRVTFEGSVKVIDFGIARAEHRITQTSAGTIKGTLGYMSPEQILGDEVDRRSDIFAFGIVLFQMLTLRNPFDGPTLKERVRALTQAPIPSVRTFNPALDDDIAHIVARCLERDTDERYPRFEEVQAALDRYLARLQAISPRQRLIALMGEVFPRFGDDDADLKAALSAVSQLGGPIDASVRLRFPDAPSTESMRSPQPSPCASAPTQPATAATHRAGSRGDAAGPSRPRSARAADEIRRDPAVLGTEPEAPTDHPEAPSGPRWHHGEAFDQAVTRPPAASGGRPRWVEAEVADTRPLAQLERPAAGAPASRWPGSWGAALVLAAVAMVTAGVVTVAQWPGPEVSAEALVGPVASGPLHEVASPTAENPPVSAGEGPEPVAKAESEARPRRREADRPRRTAPAGGAVDLDRARMLFLTGNRLRKQGQIEDAVLLYELAYAYSGPRPNPALFLNLGLLHNAERHDAKAKACLRGYVARAPSGPQARRVRMLLSSFDALPSVPCVSRQSVTRARTVETRRGAQIERWLNDTLSQRLD